MSELFPIHVRTATGLEAVLAEELLALGAKDVEPKHRLVICQGDHELIYKANLWCRTAIRVLRPLVSFPAPDEKSFYAGVQTIDWSKWMTATGTLAIDANVHSSFTTHSLYLAQLGKDAIVDQFRERTGDRPSVELESPDLRIAVSLFQDVAQVYLDSSGDSLHKRGYRKKAGEAPVSETLAAGIIALSGWQPELPLLDPMCGSGTLLIEAAMKARNVAPGLMREGFGFMRWPDYDSALFARLVTEARASIKRDLPLDIQGVELDPSVAMVARENVERAGFTDAIKIHSGNFFTWVGKPENAGVIVMNPPYDERLSVDNIAEMFQNIGDRYKKHYGGWKAYLLSGNLEALKYIGLRSSRRFTLFNGSIECRLAEYEMRAKPAEAAVEAPQETIPHYRARDPNENPKWKAKAETLANRLAKNLKKFTPWLKRSGVTCWRVYDWDVPELPFLVDFYGDRLHVSEIQRQQDHSPVEHGNYQRFMARTMGETLGVPFEKVHWKLRKPQTGGFQYQPLKETGNYVEVAEGGHRFWVNLEDHLDAGLFLDHRKTRARVQQEASGKDFLNLYAYTGSFTVYAAAGGAKSTCTVDTNRGYLEWAEENLILNSLAGPKHHFVRDDVFEFLHNDRNTYDLIVCDPPTRSVQQAAGRNFDVQRDHVALLKLVATHLRPGGTAYFSTNYRNFNFVGLPLEELGMRVTEITKETIAPDFERQPSHRCWKIKKN